MSQDKTFITVIEACFSWSLAVSQTRIFPPWNCFLTYRKGHLWITQTKYGQSIPKLRGKSTKKNSAGSVHIWTELCFPWQNTQKEGLGFGEALPSLSSEDIPKHITSPTAAWSAAAKRKPQSRLHCVNKESWQETLHQSLPNTSHPQHSKPRPCSLAGRKEAVYYWNCAKWPSWTGNPVWNFSL